MPEFGEMMIAVTLLCVKEQPCTELAMSVPCSKVVFLGILKTVLADSLSKAFLKGN